jgi:hypothetical protein
VTDHEAALSPLTQAPFDDGQRMIALDRMAAATCKCGYGSTGYALSYGKKYCERFMAETSFTAAGQKWRDVTGRCLQERQVAKLPATSQGCSARDFKPTPVMLTSNATPYRRPQPSERRHPRHPQNHRPHRPKRR